MVNVEHAVSVNTSSTIGLYEYWMAVFWFETFSHLWKVSFDIILLGWRYDHDVFHYPYYHWISKYIMVYAEHGAVRPDTSSSLYGYRMAARAALQVGKGLGCEVPQFDSKGTPFFLGVNFKWKIKKV